MMRLFFMLTVVVAVVLALGAAIIVPSIYPFDLDKQYRPTWDQAFACEQSGGDWVLFDNSCADECEPDSVTSSDGLNTYNNARICTTQPTGSCDCGLDSCWDPEVETCNALPNYSALDETEVDE